MVGVVIPVATSYVFAAPVEMDLTVARKRLPTRRWSCYGLVLQEYEELPDNTICVPEALWESLSQGAKIRVVAMENRLGFRVQEVHAR